MSELLFTAGYSVNTVAGTVLDAQGHDQKIRPRTFKLLLLFLSRPGENLSKQDILEQVWSDVVVGEHVVFQSIKEIRQIFTGLEVIKTIPKQGYTWILPVTSEALQASTVPQGVSAKPHRSSDRAHHKYAFALLVAACGILLVLLGWLVTQPEQRISGSLVVLPVNNSIEDADHRWVRLGAMDQVIQRLASGEESGVLHTDYVLDVMARANMPVQGYTQADIRNIFTVSGASLIVETTLTGAPEEYQLLYTLHRLSGSNRGVIFAKRIPEVIEKLANVISKQSGVDINALPADYHSGFANEMIANAMLARDRHDTETMIQLLEAAAASEKDNLTARRLLLASFVQQGNFTASNALLEDTLSQLSQLHTPNREQVRIVFWAGLNALQQNEIATAGAHFSEAEALATTLNDWLYLAYIAEVRGELAQYQNEFEQAEQHYQQAIAYHNVLHCPHGESNILLKLSALASDQQQIPAAQSFLQQALSLTQERKLTEMEQRALNWQEKLSAMAAEKTVPLKGGT